MDSNHLRCQECGGLLTGQTVCGLCANCLVRLALEPGGAGTAMTADTDRVPADRRLSLTECSLPDSANVASASKGQERYEMNTLHSTGGSGRVWLARDARMGREIALKELRPEHAHNAVHRERFLREARITGQLEHPGIVPVYELARRPDTGQPYYTMRFVNGRTLTDASKAFHEKRVSGDAGLLAFSVLMNAFVVVCKTVAYAHSRGVIHRDLKGQNVIMGDFGEVVVLDWGLAKLVAPTEEDVQGPAVCSDPCGSESVDLTMYGETLGTPAYMSPEQAVGRLDLIDCRTDVYGLGGMLYHLLTGQAPFNGATLQDVLGKVETEEPIPPHRFWGQAPPTLETACLRALAKLPSDRFGSASELAHEVEQWQEIERQQAIEALRESEALYHSLVECTSLNVWRKDLEGRFTFVNRGLCEAFGIAREDLIGRMDGDIVPAEMAEKYLRDDACVIATGRPLRVHEEVLLPTGEKLILEVIKIPVRDAHGQIVGTQGVFWDMTPRQSDQEEGEEGQPGGDRA